jgi:hypothetical protein
VRAGDVVEAEKRGEARLIFPTRRTLERLALFRSFDEIRADALVNPIEAITPWIEEEGGEKFITIPGHLGFPVTLERLDGLWRGCLAGPSRVRRAHEKGGPRRGPLTHSKLANPT